ncbi:LCP family protein [Streptacidiphilus sp. P02-A3a]|nr:LCP family protein [Streptacidiphilus sp. P02-A3a]
MRKAQKRGHKKVLKIVGLSTAGVLVVGGAGAGYIYYHLAGNIKSDPLYTGNNKAAAVGVEKPDAFGRTPYNLLLIGSDTRDTAADAAIGGDAGAGANADVEMVVHLSADRSNITVMSIPRDLMTNLPACTDPTTGVSKDAHYGQINSTLDEGPSCTAKAIHQLTNIPIDDFAMVDFSGVEAMSNALGGVKVCVSSNMYDLNSGLKLSQGTHTLEGKSALEFLRTRDSFGDGSDNIGRTTATHIFFTDMIDKLKSGGTLGDPLALYNIADAATKALTVSPDIDNPVKLVEMAKDMNKVPTNRITFATMQNQQDTQPGYTTKVVIAPGATTLFTAIANDQSLTTASGGSSSASKATASASATPAPPAPSAPPASSITVSVYNGTSVDGWSDVIAQELVTDGFNPATTGYSDSASPATTVLTYGPGQAAQAQVTAKALGLPGSALKQGTSAGLSLVLGADWTSGTAFPHSKPVAPPVNTAAALANSHMQNGSSNQCVAVSTSYTQPGATPAMEYAEHPNVPNSAP